MTIRGIPATLLAKGWARRLRSPPSTQVWISLALLGILVAAAVLRLKDLTELPPALHVDEASQGINGLALMEGDASILRLGFTHHLNTAFLLTGMTLKLLGTTVWALRLPEVVAGLGAVLLTYLLGRSMFSWRVGLVAALLLSVNHFAIAFSRIGLVNQQAMTVEVLSFYLLWKGFKEGRRLFAFLGGAAVATGLYLYFGAWVVPLILVAFCLWMLALDWRRVQRYGRLAAWSTLGFFIFIIPWLSFPIFNADEFHERPNGVFIFSDLDHYKDYWRTDSTLMVLREQSVNTVEFLYKGGDTSNQYGNDDPFFDPVTLWLFVVGVGIALLFFWRGSYAFLIIWMGATLVIGGVLTDTPPFVPRLMGLFPAAALLAAVGLVKPVEFLLGRVNPQRRRVISAGFLAAVVFLAVFTFQWGYRVYFQEYPAAPYTIYWPWIEPHSSIGRYLESLPPGSQAYLFRTSGTYSSQPAIQFYIYDDQVSIQDVRCGSPRCSLPPPQQNTLTAYLFVAETADIKEQVEGDFPGGTWLSFTGRSNFAGEEALLFISYEVSGDQGMATTGKATAIGKCISQSGAEDCKGPGQ